MLSVSLPPHNIYVEDMAISEGKKTWQVKIKWSWCTATMLGRVIGTCLLFDQPNSPPSSMTMGEK